MLLNGIYFIGILLKQAIFCYNSSRKTKEKLEQLEKLVTMLRYKSIRVNCVIYASEKAWRYFPTKSKIYIDPKLKKKLIRIRYDEIPLDSLYVMFFLSNKKLYYIFYEFSDKDYNYYSILGIINTEFLPKDSF
jgi:hypothetical protein